MTTSTAPTAGADVAEALGQAFARAGARGFVHAVDVDRLTPYGVFVRVDHA